MHWYLIAVGLVLPVHRPVGPRANASWGWYCGNHVHLDARRVVASYGSVAGYLGSRTSTAIGGARTWLLFLCEVVAVA